MPAKSWNAGATNLMRKYKVFCGKIQLKTQVGTPLTA
jgi:hypothetical protein